MIRQLELDDIDRAASGHRVVRSIGPSPPSLGFTRPRGTDGFSGSACSRAVSCWERMTSVTFRVGKFELMALRVS